MGDVWPELKGEVGKLTKELPYDTPKCDEGVAKLRSVIGAHGKEGCGDTGGMVAVLSSASVRLRFVVGHSGDGMHGGVA